MTRILSLDLATVTGWATHGGGVTTSGSQDFSRYAGCKSRPADHAGAPYERLRRWLVDKIAADKPEMIAYEGAGYFKSAAAAQLCIGFRGVMLSVAAQHGIPLSVYAPSKVKQFWTGKGNADKDAMMAETQRRFPDLELTDSNEADALAVLHLHLSRTGALQPAAL
jgi:Holliday junction resolvasome RuvABC endonuclease subunit